MPDTIGLGLRMRVYVDRDHAGDSVTRQPITGFIVLLDELLHVKHVTLEAIVFAMNQSVEYVWGICYRICMFGIPLEEPTSVYGNNQSVISKNILPASTLKNKSNPIDFNFVQEGCARDEWREMYVNTHENHTDLLKKPLPSGDKRWRFVRRFLYLV